MIGTWTFEEHIKKDVVDTAEHSRLQPEDGIVVTTIKLIASPCRWWHRTILFGLAVPLIRGLVECAYVPVLKRMAVCLGALKDKSHADAYGERLCGNDGLALRNLCLDIYIGFWTLILLVMYSVVCWVARLPELTSCHRCGLTVAVLIAAWRLYEICAFLGILHSKNQYNTPAKMRAIFNTLWHYVEAVLVFATFYAAVHISPHKIALSDIMSRSL